MGVSETANQGIVEQLKSISSEMIEFNRTLHEQNNYLRLITKKYNKKGYKKWFRKSLS